MKVNVKSFLLYAVIICLLGMAPVALGDWDPGGPHKMHYPQLPDPCGWDVEILNHPPKAFNQLADDWQCTESGYIDEIHLWISWQYDEPNPIKEVRVRIYDDLPAAQNPLGYSTPNNCISGPGDWVFKAVNGEFTVRYYGTGDQGWYDPLDDLCVEHDHFDYYQINIVDIVDTLADQQFADPVNQEDGEIYWLSFRVIRDGDHLMGWKTSQDHFNDCAVWNKPIVGGTYEWTKLQDCLSGEDLDLAFVVNNEDTTELYREYGDGPEDALAYPSSGQQGSFPTCKNVPVAGYIEHNNFGAWFGPMFDMELEGNAGNCPLFNPNMYDQDECFNDGDAGLLIPDSFTIQGAIGSETVVPCPFAVGMALGQTCNPAVWGANIDIDVTNTMPSSTIGYVNVLMDWNQDGAWGGSSNCPGAAVPEHVLVNYPIPNPYTGPLSALMGPAPLSFTIGPNAGYVWTRFSITEIPVAVGWDGSGVFEDGESEDYLLLIDPGTGPDPNIKWSQPPVIYIEPDIYIGWDEESHDHNIPNMVADDFLCDSNKPVTAIRWWGSWQNWYDNVAPPELPQGFHLTIWNDIPATSGGDPCDPILKWSQQPDLTTYGMDVDATEPYILADDFNCVTTGRLTDITIWASWKDDWLPGGTLYNPLLGDPYAVNFILSIHKDIPASGSPTGYSVPGTVEWIYNIPAYSFIADIWSFPIEEWWMTPPNQAYFPGDTACFIYQFHIDPCDAFLQQGTATDPIIYWLDVQAIPDDFRTKFGWKTSENHWNDDGVWVAGQEPYSGIWYELRYPPNHPLDYNSIDLAFELITTPETQSTYSHPNEIIWENYCTSYTVTHYGWEYDPRLGTVDLPKFEFYQELDPTEYWEQPNDLGVYWLGISAVYGDLTYGDPCYPWGWETREQFYNDDAVRFLHGWPQAGVQYAMDAFEPIELDGESWDLSFELISEPHEPVYLDFGDANDPPYRTLLPFGARHVIVPGLLMGATIDAEPDGQPDPTALGDDNNGAIPDDEDGVVFVSKLYPGKLARVDVTVVDATGIAVLNAWIDFDNSGTWDAAEAIAVDKPMFNGVNMVLFTVPSTAVVGPTFARFRLSTQMGLGPAGAAQDGEVEDYVVPIDELVCDWPPTDPNVGTKWVQLPDESITGIDIRLDRNDGILRVLADDFDCNKHGLLTDVHFWGSWLGDIKGDIANITLTIYSDTPALLNPPDYYSQPNEPLWTGNFVPGEFEEVLYAEVLPGEWWWDTIIVPSMGLQFGDTQIWQYNICIDPNEAFYQLGDPYHPRVYWLAIKVQTALGPGGPEFGWKTSIDHWNDSAVVSHDDGINWAPLSYPPNHELHDWGLTVDMAFAITSSDYCPTCPGDMNGDGWLSPQDVWALIAACETNPAWGYWIDRSFPAWNPCGDVNGDGWMSPQDVWALIAICELKPEWGYWIQCGDPLIVYP